MLSNIRCILFLKNILFTHSRETQRERERKREAETQAEGEAGSMQGARRGTQSRDPRITPWAEGRCSTAGPPGRPHQTYFKGKYLLNDSRLHSCSTAEPRAPACVCTGGLRPYGAGTDPDVATVQRKVDEAGDVPSRRPSVVDPWTLGHPAVGVLWPELPPSGQRPGASTAGDGSSYVMVLLLWH